MCLAPTFKNNFQNTKIKKKKVWETISIFEIFFSKLQKITYKICKFFFFLDHDKRLELMYLFILF